jgi:hypothetical protein
MARLKAKRPRHVCPQCGALREAFGAGYSETGHFGR